MRFKTGKHAGKTTEEVLLKKPDFAQWAITNHPDTPWAQDFDQLMDALDAKPFKEPCFGCKGKATRASAYRGADSLMYWCDDCRPTRSGADGDKLVIVDSIRDVLRHVDWTASGVRSFKRTMMRSYAEAKGLPKKRVGEKQALEFFATKPKIKRSRAGSFFN
jgi:hypothetical protein